MECDRLRRLGGAERAGTQTEYSAAFGGGTGRSAGREAALALVQGGELPGPVREVVQRSRVRAVELERRDGNRSFVDRSVVRVRTEPFGHLLLVQPVIGASPRVHAFLQQIARHFL